MQTQLTSSVQTPGKHLVISLTFFCRIIVQRKLTMMKQAGPLSICSLVIMILATLQVFLNFKIIVLTKTVANCDNGGDCGGGGDGGP